MKELANGKINVTEKLKLVFGWVENIVGKGLIWSGVVKKLHIMHLHNDEYSVKMEFNLFGKSIDTCCAVEQFLIFSQSFHKFQMLESMKHRTEWQWVKILLVIIDIG